MLRLYYVILISFPFVLYYLIKSWYVIRNKEDFSFSHRYQMVRRMIAIMNHNGRIKTHIFGLENLPEDGGYVMYSNHQGKYDALGIISAHKKPCSFLIDFERSKLPFAKEVTDLLDGIRLDKSDMRSQLNAIKEVINQVKSGQRFIIFPEGGYSDNHNTVMDFFPGSLKCSIRSRTPIVPVALKDSFKVFGINSLRKVHTEIHFLEPLYYDDYKEMNSTQIANIIRKRIQEAII